MTTQSQIDANRQNATHSTGPRTEAGKAISSLNHLTQGLYTRQDYVKPEEREIYKEFCEEMYSELSPLGMLEETLAAEVVGASWRLRRCADADSNLANAAIAAGQDPLLDESTEKTRRSIERARASAHSHFHRALNQLRKLQTERAILFELLGNDHPGLAECKKVEAARQKQQRTQQSAEDQERAAHFQRLMASLAPDPEFVDQFAAQYLAEQEAANETPSSVASNCSEASDPSELFTEAA